MKDTSVVGDISDSVVNFLKHGSIQVVEFDLIELIGFGFMTNMDWFSFFESSEI